MKYKIILKYYKDISKNEIQELFKTQTHLICWGDGYPQNFPYLLVDFKDNFRGKFNDLEDAKSFADLCLMR